jgi:hypothetical protein
MSGFNYPVQRIHFIMPGYQKVRNVARLRITGFAVFTHVYRGI